MALDRNDEATMREATKYAVTIRQGGNEIKFHDYDIVMELMDLHHEMEKVVSSKATLFRWCKHPKGKLLRTTWGEGWIKPLFCGKELHRYLPRNINGYHGEFPGRVFHPLIELFGKYAPEMYLYSGGHSQAACDRLNHLVEDMRAEARTTAFRRKRDAHLRSCRDATKELNAHVDKFFRRWGRALVLRLDLSYHIDETQFLTSTNMERANLVSELEARAHRSALIRYLKRKFRLRLLTYACKEELGRFTSYHYHLLLFFDGNASRSGYAVGNEIGQHWVDVVTGGKGRFHNCAYDKHVHQGVGLINYWDAEKIKALKEIVVPYLTKSDYFIRLVTKGKIFTKGGLPPKQNQGRGRPRKYRPQGPVGASFPTSSGMTSAPPSPERRTPCAPGSFPFRV